MSRKEEYKLQNEQFLEQLRTAEGIKELPCGILYRVLENKVPTIIERLKEASKTKTIILLDYDTNSDVDDPSKPLSHAFLIKAYVDGIYPYGEKPDTEAKAKVDKPQELELF